MLALHTNTYKHIQIHTNTYKPYLLTLSKKPTMSLDLIMGPMFSGKSSELIRRVNRLRTIDHSYIVYNSSDDDRYGVEGVYTHDMKSIQCISVKTLQPEYTTMRFKTSQTIFIDEAQFFKDLFNFVRDAVEIHKKHVVVIGLNGDSQRRPFGQIQDLIPYCDTITMLHALCSQCKDGTPGLFSKRMSENSQQICVGSIDTYQAVCRSCFLTNE